MSITGRNIVRDALRELGVLQSNETADGDATQQGLDVASDLLDTWRTERLTISGVTIASYDLVADTATYTIGSGGDWDQDYPTAIERWSVIPDGGETDPVEIPRGRPLTPEEWQRIAVKTLTGAYPTWLYFDRAFSAGLGTVSVYPVPTTSDPDVRLYTRTPAITTLVLNTAYTLTPGYIRAFKLHLAIELAGRNGLEPSASLIGRAKEAKGWLKAQHIQPRESPINPAFLIGASVRGHNIYTDE